MHFRYLRRSQDNNVQWRCVFSYAGNLRYNLPMCPFFRNLPMQRMPAFAILPKTFFYRLSLQRGVWERKTERGTRVPKKVRSLNGIFEGKLICILILLSRSYRSYRIIRLSSTVLRKPNYHGTRCTRCLINPHREFSLCAEAALCRHPWLTILII